MKEFSTTNRLRLWKLKIWFQFASVGGSNPGKFPSFTQQRRCSETHNAFNGGASATPRPKIPLQAQLKSGRNDKLQWKVGFYPFSSSIGAKSGEIYGGCLSNSQGSSLCCFSCPFPPMSAENAVVLAIHRAIQLTLSNKIIENQELEIISDSGLAIRWCLGLSRGPHNLSFILNFIRSTCRKFRSSP